MSGTDSIFCAKCYGCPVEKKEECKNCHGRSCWICGTFFEFDYMACKFCDQCGEMTFDYHDFRNKSELKIVDDSVCVL